MSRRLLAFLLGLLLLISASAEARVGLTRLVGGSGAAPGQTIASNALSNSSFVAGSVTATVVGNLSTVMSPTSPAFSGSYTGINGTDAASFQLSGATVETQGVLCTSSPPCTYHINPIATQAGISNSPFSGTTLTITATTPVFTAVNLSNTSFVSSTPNAVVGTISSTLSIGTPNPTYAIVSSGTDHSGTTCTSTNSTNFQIVSSTTLETNGTGLASGSYPGVCVSATQAGVTYVQAYTLVGSAAGTIVFTMTEKNTAGSTTPTSANQTCITSGDTCFRKEQPAWFALDAVPSGSIAVPSVSGSPVRYQCDEAVFWPDGSLKGCVFTLMLPQLAAGAAEQVTWNVVTGSYDHTSSGTVSDITGATNFNVTLSNENQTSVVNSGGLLPFYTNIALTLSGGTVTGGTVTHTGALNYNCTNTGAGCSAVSPPVTGCTVAPTLSVTFDATTHQANAVSASGGSGCAHDGSGNYVCSFNGSGSIYAQYKKGQVADAWDAYGPCVDTVGGASHPWLFYKFSIERDKFVDGTTYKFHAVGIISDGEYQAGANIPGYQYDGCWLNGSTAIRGYCGGSGITADVRYHGMQNDTQTAWVTIDANGLVDNFDASGALSAQDAALKAVIPSPTTGDEAYLKGSGMIPPFDDNARTPLVTSPAVLSATGTQSTTTDIGTYYPFCYCMTDSVPTWGSAGTHYFLGPSPNNFAVYYLAAPSASDSGASWLQQMRLSAAGDLSVSGGAAEPASGNAVNIVSTSTFPSLTPLRASATSRLGSDMNGTGPGPYQSTSGAVNGVADYGHWSIDWLGPWVMEGERWMERGLDLSAQAALLECVPLNREVTLSPGSSYVVPNMNCTGNGIRQAAWSSYIVAMAANFMPTNETDQPYYAALTGTNYTFMRKWTELVGTGTDGYGNVVNHNFSLASLGPYVSQRDLAGTDNAPLSQFMHGYLLYVMLQEAKWFDHLYPDLDQEIVYEIQNYFLSATAQTCAYNGVGYTIDWFLHLATNQPIPGWSSSDPTNPQQPMSDNRTDGPNICTAASSSTVTTFSPATVDWPLGSGTLAQFRVTPINMDNHEAAPCGYCTGPFPPPPSSEGTWYYYNPITATSGTISTDQAGTSPLTFTANSCQNWGMVPPNSSCPSAASGSLGFANANWENFSGSIGADSRWNEYVADAQMAKAVLGDFPNVDTTISKFVPVAGYPASTIENWRIGCTFAPGTGC
jgi:hypothetical protein